MKKTFKVSFKRNIEIFFRLYFLSLKSYFTSLINIFLGIILIIFVTFVWLTLHEDEPFLLASAVGAIIVRNGIHLFYRTLDMHRNGNMNTRIAYTPLSPWIQPSAAIFANFCINTFLSALLIGLALWNYPAQRVLVHNVDWLFFIFATFSLWVLVIFMTICVFTFVKSSIKGLIISIIFFIVSWNFLGISYPYHIVATYSGLNWALYFFPPRYMLNAMQSSWVGSRNLFYEDQQFLQGGSTIDYSVDFKLGGTMFVPFGITYGIIVLLAIILFFTLIKNRNIAKKDAFGANLLLKLSNDYISEIKRCTSFEQLQEVRSKHLDERGIKVANNEHIKTDLKVKKIRKNK